MQFKSFFTVWDGRLTSKPALDLALRLTREADGHIDILCVTATATDAVYTTDASVQILQDIAARAHAEADLLTQEARKLADAQGVNSSVRAAAVRFSEIASVVGREGRYHDMIILPRPYPASDQAALEDALDGALFETIAPVLVCPPDPVGELGRKIMVAWNGDQEAMRAIRAALPLLKEAEQVEIVMVDPRRTNDYAAPGFALMTMLTRHGVNAILSPVCRSSDRVSDTLREKAQDMGADMIVMGAYGHSRFRERLLGGATRDMLEAADLPVMMTH